MYLVHYQYNQLIRELATQLMHPSPVSPL